MTVRVLAPAKINLTLDVVGRREDGYHLLRSVMQTVDLYDVVTVTGADSGGIRLICDGGIPADNSNTAYRAAALFAAYTGLPLNVEIAVEKHIPSQAGLAGGSTDAAAVLAALNVMTESGLSMQQLCELGAKIGADVPLCVHGGTVLCTGTGTELAPLPTLADCTVVIVKPEGGVSTPQAYRLLDNAPELLRPDTDAFCRGLQSGTLSAVVPFVGNSFEQPLSLPYTADIRRRLKEGGSLADALSGSGSSVFGLFEDETTATACAERLRTAYPETFVCRPCSGLILEKLA